MFPNQPRTLQNNLHLSNIIFILTILISLLTTTYAINTLDLEILPLNGEWVSTRPVTIRFTPRGAPLQPQQYEFSYITTPEPKQYWLNANPIDNLSPIQDNLQFPYTAHCYLPTNTPIGTLNGGIEQGQKLLLTITKTIPMDTSIRCLGTLYHYIEDSIPSSTQLQIQPTINCQGSTTACSWQLPNSIQIDQILPFDVPQLHSIQVIKQHKLYNALKNYDQLYFHLSSLPPNIFTTINLAYATYDPKTSSPPTDPSQFSQNAKIQTQLNRFLTFNKTHPDVPDKASPDSPPFIFKCGRDVRLYVPPRPHDSDSTHIPLYLFTGSNPPLSARCGIPINKFFLLRDQYLFKSWTESKLEYGKQLVVGIIAPGFNFATYDLNSLYYPDNSRLLYANDPLEVDKSSIALGAIKYTHHLRAFVSNQPDCTFSFVDIDGMDINEIFKFSIYAFLRTTPDPNETPIKLRFDRYTSKIQAKFPITTNFIDLQIQIIITSGPGGKYGPLVMYYELANLFSGSISANPIFTYITESAKYTALSDDKISFELKAKPIVPIFFQDTDYYNPEAISYQELAIHIHFTGQQLVPNELLNTHCSIIHYDSTTELPVPTHPLETEIVPCGLERRYPCKLSNVSDKLEHPIDTTFHLIRGFFKQGDWVHIQCDVTINHGDGLILPKLPLTNDIGIEFDFIDRFSNIQTISDFDRTAIESQSWTQKMDTFTESVKIIVQFQDGFDYRPQGTTQTDSEISLRNMKRYESLIKSTIYELTTHLYSSQSGTITLIPNDQNPFVQINLQEHHMFIDGAGTTDSTLLMFSRGPWGSLFNGETFLLSESHGTMTLFIPYSHFSSLDIELDSFLQYFIPFESKDYRIFIETSTEEAIPKCPLSHYYRQFSDPEWAFKTHPACLSNLGQFCTADCECQVLQHWGDIHVGCYDGRCQPLQTAMDPTLFSAMYQIELVKYQQNLNSPYIDSLNFEDKVITLVGSPINNVGSHSTLVGTIQCGYDNCNDYWFWPLFSLDIKLPCPTLSEYDTISETLGVTLSFFATSRETGHLELLLEWPPNGQQLVLNNDDPSKRLFHLPQGASMNFSRNVGKDEFVTYIIHIRTLSFGRDCPNGSIIQSFFTLGLHSVVGYSLAVLPLVPAQQFIVERSKSRGQFFIGPNELRIGPSTNPTAKLFKNTVAFSLLLGDVISEFTFSTNLRIYPVGLSQSSSNVPHLADLQCDLFGKSLGESLKGVDCDECDKNAPETCIGTCVDRLTGSLYFKWRLNVDYLDFQQSAAILHCSTQELPTNVHNQLVRDLHFGEFGFAIQVYESVENGEDVEQAFHQSRVFVASTPDNDLEIINMDEISMDNLSPILIQTPTLIQPSYYTRWVPIVVFDPNIQKHAPFYLHTYQLTYTYFDPLSPPGQPFGTPQQFSQATNFTISLAGREIDSSLQHPGDKIGLFTITCLAERQNAFSNEAKTSLITFQQGQIHILNKDETLQGAINFQLNTPMEKSRDFSANVPKDIICTEYYLTLELSFYSTSPPPTTSIPSLSSTIQMNQRINMIDPDYPQFYSYSQNGHAPRDPGFSTRFDSNNPNVLVPQEPVVVHRYSNLIHDGPYSVWANYTVDLTSEDFIDPESTHNIVNMTFLELVAWDPGWMFEIGEEQQFMSKLDTKCIVTNLETNKAEVLHGNLYHQSRLFITHNNERWPWPIHFSLFCEGLHLIRPPYFLEDPKLFNQTNPPLIAIVSNGLKRFHSAFLWDGDTFDTNSFKPRSQLFAILALIGGIVIGLIIVAIVTIIILFRTGYLDEVAPRFSDALFLYWYNVPDFESSPNNNDDSNHSNIEAVSSSNSNTYNDNYDNNNANHPQHDNNLRSLHTVRKNKPEQPKSSQQFQQQQRPARSEPLNEPQSTFTDSRPDDNNDDLHSEIGDDGDEIYDLPSLPRNVSINSTYSAPMILPSSSSSRKPK